MASRSRSRSPPSAMRLLRLVSEVSASACSRFVLALIVVKMVDRRSTRDTAQALLLIVFLVIGAILTSNRFELGLVLLVFIPVIAAAVITLQIEHVRETAGEGVSVRRPSIQTRLDLRRLVWTSSLASLLISIGVFVVMPRGVGMQAFGAWSNASVGAVTGFNDEVELGNGGLISQSSTPVLDLEVYKANGEVEGSGAQPFYLRGAVLEDYKDRVWSRGADKGTPTLGPVQADTLLDGRRSVTGYTKELRVTVRNAGQRRTHLFSIWRPITAELLEPASLGMMQSDGTLIREGSRGKFGYTVWCNDTADTSIPIPTERPAPYATFPSKRIHELAAEILKGADIDPDPATRPPSDDQAAAGKFEWYLQSHYPYTLDIQKAPVGVEPIEWFLFDNERGGHCEYFASALAALCRSVGIYARVVTGYVANEWNEPTSHYIVRESDAHAWVEVQVVPKVPGEDDRWMTFDATPVADFQQIHEPSNSLLARMRRLLDTVEYAWINSVVGYNRHARSELVDASIDSSLGRFSESLGERVRAGGVGLALRALGAGMIAFAFSMGCGFLLLAIARQRGWRPGVALRRLLGRIPVRVASFLRRPTPEASLRDDMLRMLERSGRAKPDWRPLLSHAGALGAASEPASRIARIVYRARFGRRPLSPEETRRARTDLGVVRHTLRRHRS
ncbi:MAG: DUF3488 and transglutaminase-like domain-containing protein [Phycisphaerales bacterium]